MGSPSGFFDGGILSARVAVGGTVTSLLVLVVFACYICCLQGASFQQMLGRKGRQQLPADEMADGLQNDVAQTQTTTPTDELHGSDLNTSSTCRTALHDSAPQAAEQALSDIDGQSYMQGAGMACDDDDSSISSPQ